MQSFYIIICAPSSCASNHLTHVHSLTIIWSWSLLLLKAISSQMKIKGIVPLCHHMSLELCMGLKKKSNKWVSLIYILLQFLIIFWSLLKYKESNDFKIYLLVVEERLTFNSTVELSQVWPFSPTLIFHKQTKKTIYLLLVDKFKQLR